MTPHEHRPPTIEANTNEDNEPGGWSQLFPELGADKSVSAPTPKERTPQAQAPIGNSGTKQSTQSPGFDATRVVLANVERQERRAPYAPDGFDDRLEHIPALAALLSVVAPGAGQIYNGQINGAAYWATRALFGKPWVEAVRDAYHYGIKVQTDYAPRPRAKSFRRAIGFIILWHVCLWSFLAFVGWGATTLYQSKWQQKISPENIAAAYKETFMSVRLARIYALQESDDEYSRLQDSRPPFTMAHTERVERLFRIGYSYCVTGEYQLCQSMMQRVTELDKLYTHAYRLQAWAATQRANPDARQPIPNVDVTGNLVDYELQLDGDQ